jgi:hypothetical protein
MRVSLRLKIVIGCLALAGLTGALFQNCAQGKFVDPDARHTAIALGYCQECQDETGSGLSCRQNTDSAFSSCNYESCNPGLQMQGHTCALVVCTPNSVANCEVSHGEGRRTCNPGGVGYGPCSAIECESGYKLSDTNTCVKVEGEGPSTTTTTVPAVEDPAATTTTTTNTSTSTTTTVPTVAEPVCTPGTHRDCSTDTTYGTATCNEDGMAYSACQMGDCKPGYNKDGGASCVANACEPSSVTSCTVGAGYGYKTCNSIGSGWGTCEINACQQGYNLQNGVCVVQACSPGLQVACDFNHGTGTKTCNSQGTDYGTCTLLACQTGYQLQDGQCVEQVCSPGSSTSCVGEGGTGLRYCNSNGMGYGACQLNSCDQGFKLKNGLCVDADSCDEGETAACTQQYGTGLRTCNINSHRLGPCFLNACNPGYELVNDHGNACKKVK